MEIAEKKNRFCCPLAYLNPFWLISSIIKNKIRDIKREKYDYLVDCSKIIEEFPIEWKQMLTVSDEKNNVLPQKHFVDYFYKKKIKIEDPNIFITKCVEFYSIHKIRLFEQLKESKENMNSRFREEFWENFFQLFNQKIEEKRERTTTKLFLAHMCKKIKTSWKVLFSGSGHNNFSISKNINL